MAFLLLIFSMGYWDTHFKKTSFHGVEIADRITPLNAETAAIVIAEGYKEVTGRKPSKKVLALMLGQWAIETANGTRVHNFNFGNKKATDNDNYQYFRCWEVVKGKKVWYDPPSTACKFTAYSSPKEGAVAFVRLLKKRNHWWEGLHTETVEGFVKGLSTRPAYFTADPAKYAKGMKNRMVNYQQYADKYGSSPTSEIIGGMIVGAGIIWAYEDYSKPKSESKIKQLWRRK